jgi:hypothetical protein
MAKLSLLYVNFNFITHKTKYQIYSKLLINLYSFKSWYFNLSSIFLPIISNLDKNRFSWSSIRAFVSLLAFYNFNNPSVCFLSWLPNIYLVSLLFFYIWYCISTNFFYNFVSFFNIFYYIWFSCDFIAIYISLIFFYNFTSKFFNVPSKFLLLFSTFYANVFSC